jgi:hypothetical protein
MQRGRFSFSVRRTAASKHAARPMWAFMVPMHHQHRSWRPVLTCNGTSSRAAGFGSPLFLWANQTCEPQPIMFSRWRGAFSNCFGHLVRSRN